MRHFKKTAAAGGVKVSVARPDESATTVCHNLRIESRPTGRLELSPVGNPAVLVAAPWLPLAEIAGSGVLIVADGSRLGEVDLPDGWDVTVIADLGSEIRCAVVSGLRLTVMTDAGAVDLRRSPDGWIVMDSVRWPRLSLMAEETADFSVEVSARRLTGDYVSAPVQLNDSDRRAVSGDVARAYAGVVAQASAAGQYCAPALMRYRFVGHDGEVIYESPSLLLGAADSSRLTRAIEVTSADRRTLDGYTVGARGWRLRLSSPDAITRSMAAAVARIEVLACPQFHPFDPSGEAAVTVVSDAASATMIRLTMQGAGRAVSEANGAAAEARLRRMLAVQPRVERVVAVVQGPFAEGDTIDCCPAADGAYAGVADECREVERALQMKVTPRGHLAGCVTAPQRFTARCVAAAAGKMLWGDVEALRFDGYSVECFAARRGGAGSWHAAVSVSFASGDEQVVAVSDGLTDAPAAFNPLLSYPSADAVAMTLIVSSGGTVRRMTVPLTPDPSGRMSVYVDRSFAPVVLSSTMPAFVVPAAVTKSRSLPSFMVLTDSVAPVRALDVATVGDGTVNAVFVASRSQSSWDFSKVRFVALASSGISAVTVVSDGRLSLSRIDSRGVVSRNAAVEASGRVLAVAAGSLVEVGVSKAKTIISKFDADALAYDALRGELWASAGNGVSTVVDLERMEMYTRDGGVTESVGGYALVDGRLCCLCREDRPESVYVRWDGQIDLSERFVRLKGVGFDMRSSAIAYGNVSVSRMSGNDLEPSPSLRLTVDGAMGSPIAMPVLALPMRRAAFSLQGRMARDSSLAAVTFDCVTD